MEFSEIKNLTKPVEGFLGQNEGEVLYQLALKSKGKIVEVGSWKGKSTIWLAKGSEAGKQKFIYAIDPHKGTVEHRTDSKPVWTFDAFKENISHADVSQYIIPILKHSLDGIYNVPGRVGLVFIDGLDDYESAKQNFDAWVPRIENEGTIAFHDSFGERCLGVRRLVHEELFQSHFFKNVRYINGITYATKIEQANFLDRSTNRLNLLIKVIHENSRQWPQPFRSLVKRFIWRPFQKKWLKELKLPADTTTNLDTTKLY